jgi:hypothetical protein
VINRPFAFLDSNRELRQLADKAQQLQKLQRQYAQLVSAALLPTSRVQRLDQTVLTIAADNGATAAKLRHTSYDLIEAFQKLGLTLTEIRIKVQVEVTPPIAVVPPRVISNEARQELTDLANTLQDSPLKASLNRLAQKCKAEK